MRILGGHLKGRTLETTAGKKTRPTKTFVREALLNLLTNSKNFDPQGKIIVDGFAGTGIFGFEMFSRGAEQVVFFEIDRAAQSLLKRHIQDFNAEDHVTLYGYSLLKAPKAKASAHLIFLDPPYGKGLAEEGLAHLLKLGYIDEKTLVVIEEDKRTQLNIEGFELQDRRTYGRVQLCFFALST